MRSQCQIKETKIADRMNDHNKGLLSISEETGKIQSIILSNPMRI